jgi:hypothetical protein
MDMVLIILGTLGLGAIIISTYVFTVAARSYVSEDNRRYGGRTGEDTPHTLVPRNPIDRRGARPVTFPLTVNGILITNDRRSHADRRKAA